MLFLKLYYIYMFLILSFNTLMHRVLEHFNIGTRLLRLINFLSYLKMTTKSVEGNIGYYKVFDIFQLILKVLKLETWLVSTNQYLCLPSNVLFTKINEPFDK